MEKTVKILGLVKWLCFPLGYIMLFCTRDSFGDMIASCLSIIAAVSFFALVRNEQVRLIGQSIANDIRDAISEIANIENMVEIKRLKSGIIARVYLINARDKVNVIHRAIANKMEDCTFKKYLWIMQLTDMPGKSALKETQRMLNEQLLDELTKKRNGNKK